MIPKIPTRDQTQSFRETFGSPLRSFWDNITGFDVIKFNDEIIKAPNGESTASVVKGKYGQEGIDLVMDLLNS